MKQRWKKAHFPEAPTQHKSFRRNGTIDEGRILRYILRIDGVDRFLSFQQLELFPVAYSNRWT